MIKIQIEPPRKFQRENYVLEVLAPEHNQRDFDAWNSSKENLKGIFGPRSSWPNDVSDLEHNLRDLENHLREFEENKAYTYSILTNDLQECMGCLYIRRTKVDEFGARVDFWFVDKKRHLEREFYEWLNDWLVNTWKIKKPCYPGRSISWQEYYEKCED